MLLGAQRVDAQVAEAAIEARLLAEDRSPLPGVVRLEPGAAPGRRWEVEGRAGTATFTGLLPGRYSLAIEAPGPVGCRVDVEVGPADLVVVEAILGAGVPPQCRRRDREPGAHGTVFGEQPLRDLPSSRDAWSLLEVADPPAVLDRMDTGGLATGEPGRFGTRGSSWTQASFDFGGLDVTDPLETGTPLLFPDLDLLTAVGAFSALMPVEVGGPGPTLALVPRRPHSRWRAALEGLGSSGALQSVNALPGAPSIARLDSWGRAGLTADGPLLRDRLGAAVSLSGTRVRRFERDDPAEVEARLSSFAGLAVWTPTARDEVQTLAAFQGLSRPFAGGARFRGRSSAAGSRLHAQAAWTRRRAGGGTLWARAGYQRGFDDPKVAGLAGRSIERLRDGPVAELLFPTRSTRDRWDVAGGLRLASRRFAGARHLGRFGFWMGGARATQEPLAPSVPIAERVDGLPARVWEYGYAGPRARWRALDSGVYAADRLRIGERLRGEVGLRAEGTIGEAEGGAERIAWVAFSPRASLRLRLSETGRLTLLGGYGTYRHRLPLRHLAFGDPAGPQGTVFRWTDGNGDGLYQAAERGTLIARVGPGGSLSTIDAALRPPVTRELVAGLEGRLGDAFILRFTGFDRRESDLVESVNVGVPLSSYVVSTVPDPGGDLVGTQDDQLLAIYDRRPSSFGQDRYLLTNPPGHTGHHQGLELTLEGTIAGRLRYLVGATASMTEAANGNRGFRAQENDQGLVGELFDQPNAGTNAAGRIFFDRAYTIKVSATYRAPGDLRLGLAARYQDGQPFSRLVIAPSLNQGPEAIQAVPNSRHRFTFTITLDARVEKGFRVGKARLAAIAEGFNLINNRKEVEEDVVSGPGFRTVTAVQPPRTLRLGLRFELP